MAVPSTSGKGRGREEGRYWWEGQCRIRSTQAAVGRRQNREEGRCRIRPLPSASGRGGVRLGHPVGRGRDGEVANGKVPEEEEVVVASPHLHRPLLPPLPPPRSGEGREVVISDFGERGERENEGGEREE